MLRDFTYIDDIVNGIYQLTKKIPERSSSWSPMKPDPSFSSAPYRIFNIGNNKPTKLLDFIELIEQSVGKKAKISFMDMQPGDVESTFADIDAINCYVVFTPQTNIYEGVEKFVRWYKRYYKKN